MEKKKTIKLKRYFLKLTFQIIFSSVLLFGFIFLNNNFDQIIYDNVINNNLSLLKVPFLISKTLPQKYQVDDTLVYDKMTYDQVYFDGEKNIVKNISFNGVTNLVDGVIIKIKKNFNNTYNVTVQNVEGVLYEYCNLESVDFGIYTYIKSQTIIGRSVFNTSNDMYEFELIIKKDGVNYDFYEFT